MKRLSFYILVGTMMGLGCLRAQHAGDILIGQTAAQQLGATNLPARTVYLTPVASGPFQGWSSTVLGFDAILETNTVNGLSALVAGANVFLEVVTIDPGLSLRSFTAPATVFADAPGERLRIGSTGNLHNHPIVFIDRAVVGTNFLGERRVTLRLVDTGTAGLLPSAEYELTFAPVIPASLLLRHSGAEVILSLATHPGLAYQIQSAPTPSGAWTNDGSFIVGNGAVIPTARSITSGAKFYRVRSFPDN